MHKRDEGIRKMNSILFLNLLLIFCCISTPHAQPQPIQTQPANKTFVDSLEEIKGEILDSKCWKDKQSNSCIIIWGSNNKGGNEKAVHSEINAAQFSNAGLGFKKVWQIHDFSDRQLQWVSLDSNSLKIIDIDGDGIAESRFFYSIVQDGLDPYQLKYMLHVKDKKFAIRGIIPMDEDNISKYAMTPDASLSTLSPTLKDYAVADWNKKVKPILKELTE